MTLLAGLVAVLAGGAIGLSLGALGGGGSILAVPVLVYALGQSPSQATTGSLVVVGTTALIGSVTAWRAGNVVLGRGAACAAVSVAGAAVGARAAVHVAEPVLLAAFAVLMLGVAALMAARQLRGRWAGPAPAVGADEPIITFRPRLGCRCSRALRVVVAATTVGLLTGLLGVGGGFLVVPARADTRRLAGAFTVLVLLVSVYTAARALPALA